MKTISTDLLIPYFKSLINHLDFLNKALWLALLCPNTQHRQQLTSAKSLIQIPQKSIKTLTLLLGALFSATGALPSPTSSHFALLVWGSSSCQFLEDCTRLQLHVARFYAPQVHQRSWRTKAKQLLEVGDCLRDSEIPAGLSWLSTYGWSTQSHLKITCFSLFSSDQQK